MQVLSLLLSDLSDPVIVIISASRHGDLDHNTVEGVIGLFDLLSEGQGQGRALLSGLLCVDPNRRVVNSNDLPVLLRLIECFDHFECGLNCRSHDSFVEQGHNVVDFDLAGAKTRAEQDSNAIVTVVFEDVGEGLGYGGRRH